MIVERENVINIRLNKREADKLVDMLDAYIAYRTTGDEAELNKQKSWIQENVVMAHVLKNLLRNA